MSYGRKRLLRGWTSPRFDAIPAAVERAIAEKKLPGAVVLVGRGDRVALPEGVRPARGRAGAGADDDGHDLRPGVADESRGDDDQRDEARGGRADPAERSGRDYIPGFERYSKAASPSAT